MSADLPHLLAILLAGLQTRQRDRAPESGVRVRAAEPPREAKVIPLLGRRRSGT